MSYRSIFLGLVAGAMCIVLGGCANTIARNGIASPSVASEAVIADLPGVRFWGDIYPSDFVGEVRRRLPNMPTIAQGATRTRDGRPIIEILALSGGGGDGAFGAGFLSGWSDRGTRPEFEVVTGVSAGAVIAPFAYLGPEYDEVSEKIWTQYQTSQIAVAQVLPGLLGGSALADSAPFAELIAQYVDKRLLRAIARQYRRGRMLLVGTTNLDAQRPVVWNMGEIAASGHPDSLELFRKVILASAAIPGALPPVSIDVSADGQHYSELHVDGGTTREVFVSPVNVPFATFNRFYSKPPQRRFYIIKNGKIDPEQEITKAQTLSIASRAISTLIKNQSLGETYKIYRMAKDDGAEFNFAAVPPSFNVKSNEFFDPAYQRALFDEGRRLASSRAPWLRKPPDQIPGRTDQILRSAAR